MTEQQTDPVEVLDVADVEVEAPVEDGAPAEPVVPAEDAEDAASEDAPRSKKETVLENEGEIAADYLEELLDIADLDGDIDTFIEGGRAHISILTDGDVLVGKDGEVLEALQELARLAVMTETGHRSRLMLDIGGHRDRRRRILQDLAKDAVAEVNESGEPVRLAPMNPFERKIVHDSVAAAGLLSESEGEEPNRRVVVLPKA
ncbi:MAG: R3H domain-containing nucleic acid-binding protein [Propionicimonas sp.]|uniref:Jag family protein n=1 Tax=Propionicimonas sp. TaxID=1955623 RepID=UPI003D11FCE2